MNAVGKVIAMATGKTDGIERQARQLATLENKNASSAELRELVTELQSELDHVDGELAVLERTERSLLVRGSPDALADVEARIQEKRRVAKRAMIMLDDLGPRIKEAERVEKTRALESTGEALREKNRKLRDLYLQLLDRVPALNALIAEGIALKAEIKADNALLRENGRQDLRVHDPLGQAAQAIGHPHVALHPLLQFTGGIGGEHPDRQDYIQALKALKL